MNNLYRNIALLLGGYLLIQHLSSRVAENFSVKKARLSFGSPSFDGVGGLLTMHVQNSTPLPVPVSHVEGLVSYSGQQIASFVNSEGFTVQPNGETAIQIPFFVPYDGLSAAIVNAIASGQFSTYAVVSGSARIKGVNIPFTQAISPI